jgi:hypothetical protein
LRVDRSDPSIPPSHLYPQLGSEAVPPIVRWTRTVPALLAAALVALLLPAAAAQNARGNVDIGQKTGVLTDYFDFLPVPEGAQSPWALVEDATAAGGVALEQRGTPTYANHSLAVYKPASVTDAEISLRIKATGGTEDQGGGIALRLTAPDSYYLVEMDARRDRVVFLRVANGATEEIVGVDADIATNEWHRLAVRAVVTNLSSRSTGPGHSQRSTRLCRARGASRFGPPPTASHASTASRSFHLRRRRGNGDHGQEITQPRRMQNHA